MPRPIPLTLRHELIGLSGVVERNWYLVKRYAWWELTFFFWTVANTLTIVFIAKGVQASGVSVNVNRLTTVLLIGAVVWAYLGIIFEILTETVAWERWEGTIEYTFMAPLSRPVHLFGMGLLAVSGVYYPVAVLPQWMQWLAKVSPATYALRGIRDAILDGAGIGALWVDIWPLLLIGLVAIPLGLETFRRGERYAKQHGKLKR